jgi:hypothetical protein
MTEAVAVADDLSDERRTRGPIMTWEQYCDGREHKLVRGRDFEGSALTKRSSFRQWGKRVHFRTADGSKLLDANGKPVEGFQNTRETVRNTADQVGNAWFTIEVRPEAWPEGAVAVWNRLHDPRPKQARDPLEVRREQLAGEGDPDQVVRTRRMRRS